MSPSSPSERPWPARPDVPPGWDGVTEEVGRWVSVSLSVTV